jgi:predicted 3-demethylubiquinone-9 3-methyltransferase (glyoxalase superfamily)
MRNNKITPFIWLTTEKGLLTEVIEYYRTVFEKDFKAGDITSLGQTLSGNTEMCEIIVFGQNYSLMSTEKEHHPLNDAISFIISCDGQNEIDHYWNYFTEDGKESQCGWCIDKYGVRWQIIPKNLKELMAKPNAYDIMMTQKKIIINTYLG